MTFIVNDQHKETVKRMAGNGLNMNMVATAIGCCEKTLRTTPELLSIYHDSYVKQFEEVGESLINRALAGEEGSDKLLMFLANTRLRWSKDQFTADVELKGSYAEKKVQLDDYLANKTIDINEYQKLSNTICEQYKVDEHEQRLTALEKAVTQNQNVGGYKSRDDV